MTVFAAQPNHPLRLAGVFGASLLAFGLVAMAVAALLYIIDSERGPAPSLPSIEANVDLPPGMVLVRRVEGPDAWLSELGFRPVEALSLPDGVSSSPAYFVQQPDIRGRSAGHLRYGSDGGPSIVLVELEGTLRTEARLTSEEVESTRSYFDAFACGPIVVQAQLYFSLDESAFQTAATTAAIAEDFVARLRAQCG